VSPALRVQIAKVRALRNLANSASQHEAEVAAAMADALIQKYRLSEAEIGSGSGTEPQECVGEDGTPLAIFGAKLTPWRAQLGGNLARHYGCAVFVLRSREVTLQIVGRPSDIEIVRYMYAWLTAEITRLSQTEADRRSRGAFCLGATVGLHAAMQRSRAVAEGQHGSEHGSGAAMVLASRSDEAKRWMGAAHVFRKKTVGGGRVSDAAAFMRGGRAGASIHVGHALDGKTTRALAGGK